MAVPGRNFRFSIDRGGTFTDVYAEVAHPGGRTSFRVLKLLSEDPANYADAPREGIRRILEEETGVPHPRDRPIDTSRIEFIRMGTTVATNALLERKGERTALLVTKGFRDLLHIGNQSRPRIFDLEIKVPDLLYEQVVEVEERLVLADVPGGSGESDVAAGAEAGAEADLPVVVGTTGERFVVRQAPSEEAVRAALARLYADGFRSVAIVFMHAYAYGAHEALVAQWAREAGFSQVSRSSDVMPMVKIVPRGHTTCADAYLTPHITRYIRSFMGGFDANLLRDVKVSFMQSDGGLSPVDQFSGHKAILSGPAGGVVGYALTTYYDRTPRQPVVGFDMGGTSTDVSRFDGRFEHVYETTTAGVTIQAPQLDVNTVAAGGGSRLFFRAGLFAVGPESVGAHPGPVCYRKGGQLAITDANLVLGRILPDFFPKIFGPHENEPLDAVGARAAMQRLTDEINEFHRQEDAEGGAHASAVGSRDLSVDEVAFGFLKVANEAMCRPIRALTQMKGFDITKHILACFGGAGGQHACAIARALGMRTIFVHRFSGILSAFGIGLADVAQEEQEPASLVLARPGASAADPLALDTVVSQGIAARLLALARRAARPLLAQGFLEEDLGLELFVNIRYSGTDSAIMTPVSEVAVGVGEEDSVDAVPDRAAHGSGASTAAASGAASEAEQRVGASPHEYVVSALFGSMANLQVTDSEASDAAGVASLGAGLALVIERFVEHYRREFGFVLSGRDILVDDLRVRAVGHGTRLQRQEVAHAAGDAVPLTRSAIYFEGGRRDTPVFRIPDLAFGHRISGPALLLDATSTILVEPGYCASITRHGDVEIVAEAPSTGAAAAEAAIVDAAATAEASAAEASVVVPSTPSASPPVAIDPILLSIFSHRFMSIAEQMGRTLQRTSISVNIKERLDFSCALFGPDGGLVANAPHIPVHLGAMQEAVRFQLKHWGGDLHEGDVLVSNHPQLAGGSHLPDITVMTPVFSVDGSQIVFFVASRGHHADIGGIAPGSMPPLSKSLAEEGAAIVAFKLVQRGEFDEAGIRDLLEAPGRNGIPNCTGTRNLRDCLSDLRAQVAANHRGILLVRSLIEEYSLGTVHAYMRHIQNNAAEAVREMLMRFAHRRHWTSADGSVSASLRGERTMFVTAEDFMDDGTPIRLRVTLDEKTRGALFDFEGTGPEVFGNANAPPAVTYSAVIYSLRCLVGADIPLNQGCLAPIRFHIPEGTLLHPSPTAAVVGGNVLTSQRVVDVVLRALEAAAASQGCMNNLTFGDARFGYYETIAGGAGAGPTWHGRSGVHTHMTNTRITDPEILERRYPVILRRFVLRDGSGGAGRFRGGDGVIRDIEFRRPLTVSILSERRSFQPFGLAGGGSGARGLNWLHRRDGRIVTLGGKNTVDVDAGDMLSIMSPGGGAFGSLGSTAAAHAASAEEAPAGVPARHGGGSVARYEEAQHSV